MESAIASHIQKYLTCFEKGYDSRMSYDNAIMTDKFRNKYDKKFHCRLKQWKRSYEFDILSEMSEYVTLVQLTLNLGNVRHSVTISCV